MSAIKMCKPFIFPEGTSEEQLLWAKTIAVDFDGVIHSFENGWDDGSIYGTPTDGCIEALTKLKDQGYRIIINTARIQDLDGQFNQERYDEMVKWLNDHEIPFDDVHQKLIAVVYIDDRGVNCDPINNSEKDWNYVLKRVQEITGEEI